MEPGLEFINVAEPHPPGSPPDPGRRTFQQLERDLPHNARFQAHQDNATNLRLMCTYLRDLPRRSGILYFPPGRWVIGRPSGPPAPDEQAADLAIPEGVTLLFAAGAVLVPAGYTPGDESEAPWVRRELPGFPESEGFKVRISVYGVLDAPVLPIFDPFMEDPRTPGSVPTVPAGRVFFQREAVRVVHPEWWGAVPLRNEDPTQMTAAEVRRTTAALQAAFDAAANHRYTLTNPALGPLDLAPRLTPLPVELRNDYAIDRPLRLGVPFDAVMNREFDVAHSPPRARHLPTGNVAPVVRGACGPATRRLGAALLVAAPGFRAHRPGELADGARRARGASIRCPLSHSTRLRRGRCRSRARQALPAATVRLPS